PGGSAPRSGTESGQPDATGYLTRPFGCFPGRRDAARPSPGWYPEPARCPCALGVGTSSGRNRVPRPPTRTTASTSLTLLPLAILTIYELPPLSGGSLPGCRIASGPPGRRAGPSRGRLG